MTACREAASSENVADRICSRSDDLAISRQMGESAAVRLIVYPGAYAGFDLSILRAPVLYLGHRIEYNKSAAEQSSDALREFLSSLTKP